MSTRGCVAVGTETEWKGVYNHWDSYPTGLGKELWDHLRGRNLDLFAMEMLKYDDWRNYLNGGVCEYCGRKGQGQPHSISGVIFMKGSLEASPEIRRNIERTGYPDPKAKHHKHGDLSDKITSDNPDPLFIEWVYVVNTTKRTLTVLSSRSDGKTRGKVREGKPILREDGYFDYGHCAFRHVKVAEIPLDGEEPNWRKIERRGR